MGAKVFFIHSKTGTLEEFTNKFPESTHLLMVLKHLYPALLPHFPFLYDKICSKFHVKIDFTSWPQLA